MYATLFFNDSHCVIHLPLSLSLPLPLYLSAACCCLGVHFYFRCSMIFNLSESTLPANCTKSHGRPSWLIWLQNALHRLLARSLSLTPSTMLSLSCDINFPTLLAPYTHTRQFAHVLHKHFHKQLPNWICFHKPKLLCDRAKELATRSIWLPLSLSPTLCFLCVCHDIKIAESSEFLYSCSSPERAVCVCVGWLCDNELDWFLMLSERKRHTNLWESWEIEDFAVISFKKAKQTE